LPLEKVVRLLLQVLLLKFFQTIPCWTQADIKKVKIKLNNPLELQLLVLLPLMLPKSQLTLKLLETRKPVIKSQLKVRVLQRMLLRMLPRMLARRRLQRLNLQERRLQRLKAHPSQLEQQQLEQVQRFLHHLQLPEREKFLLHPHLVKPHLHHQLVKPHLHHQLVKPHHLHHQHKRLHPILQRQKPPHLPHHQKRNDLYDDSLLLFTEFRLTDFIEFF
jgi:hypothetical protein